MSDGAKLFKFTIKGKTWMDVYNSWEEFGAMLDKNGVGQVDATAYGLPYAVEEASAPEQLDFKINDKSNEF